MRSIIIYRTSVARHLLRYRPSEIINSGFITTHNSTPSTAYSLLGDPRSTHLRTSSSPSSVEPCIWHTLVSLTLMEQQTVCYKFAAPCGLAYHPFSRADNRIPFKSVNYFSESLEVPGNVRLRFHPQSSLVPPRLCSGPELVERLTNSPSPQISKSLESGISLHFKGFRASLKGKALGKRGEL